MIPFIDIHSHILPGSDKLVKWLLQRNIRPVIVHPERNKELQADISKITPFIAAGCLLQITAGSLTGRFGCKSQQIAQLLIDNKWAHLIATDSHNIKNRPPELAEVNDYLSGIIGISETRKLLYDNPWRIIKNKF